MHFALRGKAAPRLRPIRLLVEELEGRFLPNGGPWPTGFQPVAAAGTNVTLDKAQDFQTLTTGSLLGATGTIGDGPAGAADVAYYRFTLAQALRVHLETFDQPQANHLDAVLSLYNTDPQDPLGHHLLAQDDAVANNGYAAIDQTLGTGTYYIAVSGSGNDYFDPFLVGSGYNGATGSYAL